MKNIKQMFFATMLVIGVSITASAQKEDKKPPPKDKNPPVIVVKPKDPKEDKPKEDKPNDGKKPQLVIFNNRYDLNSE